MHQRLLAGYYSNKNNSAKIFVKGIEDNFVEHGTRSELLEIVGLDENGIKTFINDRLNNE